MTTKIENLTMLKCPPNLDIIDIRVPFSPKTFFDPTTQNKIFGPFLDPKFSNFFFFGLKNPTFKCVYRPQNFIFYHFLAGSKYPIPCSYLTKIFWSKNIWYFLHFVRLLKSKTPNIFRPKYLCEIWTYGIRST